MKSLSSLAHVQRRERKNLDKDSREPYAAGDESYTAIREGKVRQVV